MGEEKKTLGRRGFLKGAAVAGVAAAVSGGGVFVKDLGAQRDTGKVYKRSDVKEPQGVIEDRDVLPLAESIANSCMEGAIDAFNAAAEEVVKGKALEVNTHSMLRKNGLNFRSQEAMATAKNLKVPASILKIREEQMKQKGWHSHATIRACWGDNCGYLHWHVTW